MSPTVDCRFKIGDIVHLPSEDCPMTVTGICDLTSAVECSWLSRDRILRREWLPHQAVRAVV